MISDKSYTFSLNQLVWAKVHPFPKWPSVIYSLDPLRVIYLGEKTYSDPIKSETSLKPFNMRNKNHKINKKYAKSYNKGIDIANKIISGQIKFTNPEELFKYADEFIEAEPIRSNEESLNSSIEKKREPNQTIRYTPLKYENESLKIKNKTNRDQIQQIESEISIYKKRKMENLSNDNNLLTTTLDLGLNSIKSDIHDEVKNPDRLDEPMIISNFTDEINEGNVDPNVEIFKCENRERDLENDENKNKNDENSSKLSNKTFSLDENALAAESNSLNQNYHQLANLLDDYTNKLDCESKVLNSSLNSIYSILESFEESCENCTINIPNISIEWELLLKFLNKIYPITEVSFQKNKLKNLINSIKKVLKKLSSTESRTEFKIFSLILSLEDTDNKNHLDQSLEEKHIKILSNEYKHFHNFIDEVMKECFEEKLLGLDSDEDFYNKFVCGSYLQKIIFEFQNTSKPDFKDLSRRAEMQEKLAVILSKSLRKLSLSGTLIINLSIFLEYNLWMRDKSMGEKYDNLYTSLTLRIQV